MKFSPKTGLGPMWLTLGVDPNPVKDFWNDALTL